MRWYSSNGKVRTRSEPNRAMALRSPADKVVARASDNATWFAQLWPVNVAPAIQAAYAQRLEQSILMIRSTHHGAIEYAQYERQSHQAVDDDDQNQSNGEDIGKGSE